MKHSRGTGKCSICKYTCLLLLAIVAHNAVTGHPASIDGSVERPSKMYSSFSLNTQETGDTRSEEASPDDDSPSPGKSGLQSFFEASSDNEANESNDFQSYTRSGVQGTHSAMSNDEASSSSEKESADVKSNGHQINYSNYHSDEGLKSHPHDTDKRPAQTMRGYSKRDSHLQSDESLAHLRGASKLWVPTYDHRVSKDHLIQPSTHNMHTLVDSLGDETSNRAKYSSVKAVLVSPLTPRRESFAEGPLGNYNRVVGVKRQIVDEDKSGSTVTHEATRSSTPFVTDKSHSGRHTSTRQYSSGHMRPSTLAHSNNRDFISSPSLTFHGNNNGATESDGTGTNGSKSSHLIATGSTESTFNSPVSSSVLSDDHSNGRHSQRQHSHSKQKSHVTPYVEKSEQDNYLRRSFTPVKHYHDHEKMKATHSNYKMGDTSKVNDALGR